MLFFKKLVNDSIHIFYNACTFTSCHIVEKIEYMEFIKFDGYCFIKRN